MNWRILLAMTASLVSNQVRADLGPTVPQAANLMCRQAIAAAERAHGIPPHLLAAIARVESGRRDQVSGTFNPWPWTINADGVGSFYDNKQQAVTAAGLLRPNVARSIDVGCMQISLTYHPTAFTTLEQAFDPLSNSEYGARFLVQLYEKSGSWPRAVELYHSATPDLGRDYQQKVYAVLPEETKLAEAAQPAPTPLATAWASTLFRSAPISSLFRQAPPHIIPRATGPGGEAAPGRSLEAYRSSPVRFAFRAP
jgi:hypothetical protein